MCTQAAWQIPREGCPSEQARWQPVSLRGGGTRIASHPILMVLINYFSCFLRVLNVIVTNNPVSGTMWDVGGSWLHVTGGETEAAHPGGFSRITGKFVTLRELGIPGLSALGLQGGISHTG